MSQADQKTQTCNNKNKEKDKPFPKTDYPVGILCERGHSHQVEHDSEPCRNVVSHNSETRQ